MTEPAPLPDRRRGTAPRPAGDTTPAIDVDVLARTAARLRDIPSPTPAHDQDEPA